MEPPHLSFRHEVIIFVWAQGFHQVFLPFGSCAVKFYIFITDWEQVLSAN